MTILDAHGGRRGVPRVPSQKTSNFGYENAIIYDVVPVRVGGVWGEGLYVYIFVVDVCGGGGGEGI